MDSLDLRPKCHFRTKIKRNDHSKSNSQSLHTPQPSRTNSVRSNGRGAAADNLSSDHSDGEQGTLSKYPRRLSGGSKPPSRPASRLSRFRANSSAASAPVGEVEKQENGRPRRLSVAEWASNAVDSVTGSKGKKSKDKEAFETLDGDAKNVDEYQSRGPGGTLKKTALGPRSSSKGKSRDNLPSVVPKILKPPSMQGKKVVRALYDFSGSTDELSFKSGNEIVVLNEVLDDWWMGELDGETGLFPLSYTKAASASSHADDPHEVGVLEDVNGYGKHDDYLTSDVLEERELAAAPMVVRSPLYGTFNDAISFTSSVADDEDDFRTQPMSQEQTFSEADHRFVPRTPQPPRRKRSTLLSDDPAQQSLINGVTDDDPSSNATAATPTKKPPPPPPPPRRPVNQTGPPVPERRPPVFISRTSSSGSSLNVTPSSSIGSHHHGYDRSPFESATELEETIGCVQFRQNPFKPEGMCSNCLEFHD